MCVCVCVRHRQHMLKLTVSGRGIIFKSGRGMEVLTSWPGEPMRGRHGRYWYKKNTKEEQRARKHLIAQILDKKSQWGELMESSCTDMWLAAFILPIKKLITQRFLDYKIIIHGKCYQCFSYFLEQFQNQLVFSALIS